MTELRSSRLSETEIYTDVAFMYLLLMMLLVMALAIVMPRLTFA